MIGPRQFFRFNALEKNQNPCYACLKVRNERPPKKGMSAHQMHRMLGISYKSTWFMCHRLREAMRTGGFAPIGGDGSIVEIDETFIGRKQGVEVKQGVNHKHAVLTLVERGGSAHSFHLDEVTKAEILPIVRANLARESYVMTDEAARYAKLGNEFAKHDAVDHSRGEYGYTDRKTNIQEAVTKLFGCPKLTRQYI